MLGRPVVSVVFAGLGGQGVVTVSDILADAAFAEGYDVKKSDIHGMAQRGGAVASDVRFGPKVLSPMIAPGEADYVVVLDETQVDSFRDRASHGGELLSPSHLPEGVLGSGRSANIALLALLASKLTLPQATLEAAIRSRLKPKLHGSCLEQFRFVLERKRECAGADGGSPSARSGCHLRFGGEAAAPGRAAASGGGNTG